MKAIRIHEHGGPEVLRHQETENPDPVGSEVIVRVAAIGVNFIDVYHRTGLYPQKLPMIPGSEGAGTVVAIGPEVKTVKNGDRVAWAQVPGSYAEYVRATADKLVKIPEGISDKIAAAVMLQGLTAHYLATSTFPLKKGHTALIHAAAGGVGLLLTQIAKLKRAIVIGTTSTDEKANLARSAGADYVIPYTRTNVAEEVRKITGGRGVDVAYDSVGKTTFESSIDSLRPRGMLVSFGNSSGPVGPIDPLLLSKKGSLFLTRPTLVHYAQDHAELEMRAKELFEWILQEKLKVHIDREVPLAKAGEAHRALEGRETVGKVILIP